MNSEDQQVLFGLTNMPANVLLVGTMYNLDSRLVNICKIQGASYTATLALVPNSKSPSAQPADQQYQCK